MLDPSHHRWRGHHRDRDFTPRMHPSGWVREWFNDVRPGRPLVRRGEVRTAILAALGRRPMHGYEVIQELEAESGGRWRPSAGSVYPTLQQLQDEGLVRSEEVDGRRTYSLTEEGRAAVAAAPTGPAPGAGPQADASALEVRTLALQLVSAVMQVQRIGSPRAKRETSRILLDARRSVYRLLAEDEGDVETTPTAGPTPLEEDADRS
jgi:DNA-binding PadR family transcriptional regulator